LASTPVLPLRFSLVPTALAQSWRLHQKAGLDQRPDMQSFITLGAHLELERANSNETNQKSGSAGIGDWRCI